MKHTHIQTAAWNTRNGYTEHGQRIGAVRELDNTIVFVDIDRGITGIVPKWFKPIDDIKTRVTGCYMLQQCDYWSRQGMAYERYAYLKAKAEKEASHAPSLKGMK